MKDWILELCPEIEPWQAELIAEQANQAVLAEREACAKVCDEMWTGYGDCGAICSSAIRARNNQ